MSWWTLNMAPYQCRSRAIRFPRLSLNCMLVNEEPCGWYPQKTGMRLVSPLSKRRDQLLLSPVMVNLFFTTGQVVKVRIWEGWMNDSGAEVIYTRSIRLPGK